MFYVLKEEKELLCNKSYVFIYMCVYIYIMNVINVFDVFQATEESERTTLSLEQLTNQNKELETQVRKYLSTTVNTHKIAVLSSLSYSKLLLC